MKRRLAFPQGILGLYTAIIIVGSLYPIGHLMRSPGSSKMLLIPASLYFFTVGIFLWLRIRSASWLFLGGVLGLSIWSVKGMIAQGFSFNALIMLIAWLIALPGTLVIREEIRVWHRAPDATANSEDE